MNRITNTNSSLKKNNTVKQNNSIKQNNTVKTNIVPLQTSTTGYSNSALIGIVILVIIIIVFAGSAYWLYNYYSTRSFITAQKVEVLSDITDATNKTIVASGTIPSSNTSNEYSISFWMNINDYNYNYGKEKVIIRRGLAGSGNPEIFLDSKKNDLIVRVKLQAGANNSSSGSISSFEDIPININKNNCGGGVTIDKEEPYYTYGKFNADNNDINPVSPSFKVGDNIVDYPTIQYTMGTGVNSDIINNSINMPHNDTVRVSSTNDYFNMISGNNVKEGFSNGEEFTNIDDATNASITVLVDICDIATSFQDVNLANTSVDSLNAGFDMIITTLEQTRTGSKTADDVSKAFVKLVPSTSNISGSQISKSNLYSSTLQSKFTKLTNDFNALAKYENVVLDMNTITPIINAKMKTINCPLTFDGKGEVDNTISFYENMIKLIKKTIFTFINNMGVGIRKTYPDLSSGVGSSCGADNIIPNDPTVGKCISKMIPLQKWVNVIVSIYNQIVDIYIDGQLTSSCVLKGFPDINTSDVDITPDGGFSGNMSRVNFMNTAMTVQQARSIYNDGPVKTQSLYSMIPSWVWWTILAIIIIVILYSIFA